MNEFCHQIAAILEVESIAEADLFDNIPEWDSLSNLSVIAMIDSTYGVNLTAAQVREAGTPAGLWKLVQALKKS